MPIKLDYSLQKELQNLIDSYEIVQSRLDKEEKSEYFGRIAGIVGAIVVLMWIIEPQQTTDSVGSLGLTIAFISVLGGAWVWFAPPSKNPNRPEAYKRKSIMKSLEHLGFEPHIINGRVKLKDSERWIDPRDSGEFTS